MPTNPPISMLRNSALTTNVVNQSNETDYNQNDNLSDINNDEKSLTLSKSNQNVKRNSVSLKHYDSLICELKCPGCSKPFMPPIKLCETGHSICDYCTKTLLSCPLCRKGFTENRSVTVEALSNKANFNCSNKHCTVRLPLKLMEWHKKKCIYQIGDCFMGKVWNTCKWTGREIDWMDHCIEQHNDKIWERTDITTVWNYKDTENNQKPIKGYYIFKVFNEIFNLYHIYDKTDKKVLWTLICASKEFRINKRFVYEIEIFLPNDETLLLKQRNACHAESDNDVMEDGRCIKFMIGDLMRLMDSDKNLHYRIKIIEINDTKSNSSSQKIAYPIDYKLTSIAESNYKNIPATNIITRQIENNDEYVEADKNVNNDEIESNYNNLNDEKKSDENELLIVDNLENKQLEKNNTIEREIISIKDLKRMFMESKEFTIDDKIDEIIVDDQKVKLLMLEKQKQKQFSSNSTLNSIEIDVLPKVTQSETHSKNIIDNNNKPIRKNKSKDSIFNFSN